MKCYEVVVFFFFLLNSKHSDSRSLKLKMEQEQRAHEQEMHRLNLPQSAFCNAACDLADENRGQTDNEKASETHTNADQTEEVINVEKDGVI